MDKQYIKDNEVIERYLLGQISDNERQEFRVALLFDESLRQEVEDTRLLHQHIQQLKMAKKQPKPKKIIWWLIGSLLMISIATVAYFANKNNFVKKQENTPSTIEMPQKTIKKTTEPATDELLKEEQIEEKKEENQLEIEPFVPEKKVTTPKKSSPPIAAADTKTHPYLDQFVTGGFRNNQVKITVNSPKINEKLTAENGKINLNIKAVLSLDKTPEKERFVVRLFSNKKADFDNFKPILSDNPTISESDNQYNLSFNAIVPLPKGLYYFIIEDNEKEDMIYVGKFLVG